MTWSYFKQRVCVLEMTHPSENPDPDTTNQQTLTYHSQDVSWDQTYWRSFPTWDNIYIPSCFPSTHTPLVSLLSCGRVKFLQRVPDDRLPGRTWTDLLNVEVACVAKSGVG